jgi:hypothetical protein
VQATRNRRRAGTPAKSAAGAASKSKRQVVEAIFRHYGLPGWLGWGTMGAESTYGSNGSFAFGGIDLPNSGNGEWKIEARESAIAYKRLVEQYGSVAAAVPHYSGNSYTVAHVKSLARGGSQQGAEAVDVSFWQHLPEFFTNPGGALGQSLGEGLGEGKGVPNPLAPAESAIGAVGGLVSFLTDINTWLRLGEVLAGALLIYLALKNLTGLELPSVVPVPV